MNIYHWLILHDAVKTKIVFDDFWLRKLNLEDQVREFYSLKSTL